MPKKGRPAEPRENREREAIAAAPGGITAMKDPTRGGVASALHEMAEQGTTTVEAKSGYGLTLDSEIKSLEAIRGRITADGSSGFPAEAGRYHLFVAHYDDLLRDDELLYTGKQNGVDAAVLKRVLEDREQEGRRPVHVGVEGSREPAVSGERNDRDRLFLIVRLQERQPSHRRACARGPGHELEHSVGVGTHVLDPRLCALQLRRRDPLVVGRDRHAGEPSRGASRFEHVQQRVARAVRRVCIVAVERGLGEFDEPVAELVPGEFVQRAGHDIEAVVGFLSRCEDEEDAGRDRGGSRKIGRRCRRRSRSGSARIHHAAPATAMGDGMCC